MKITFHLRLLAGFICLGVCSARALDWKKKEITLDVRRGVDEVRAVFDFTNPGRRAVRILEISTSCGCTTATAGSEVIASGKNDRILALFTVGKRTGLQEKHITVLTDESDEPVELVLRVNILEAPADSSPPKSGV